MNLVMEVEIYDSEITGKKAIWVGAENESGWEEEIDDPTTIGDKIQRYLEIYHPEIM